eukprot:163411-Rhodomonas_salina.1
MSATLAHPRLVPPRGYPRYHLAYSGSFASLAENGNAPRIASQASQGSAADRHTTPRYVRSAPDRQTGAQTDRQRAPDAPQEALNV